MKQMHQPHSCGCIMNGAGHETKYSNTLTITSLVIHNHSDIMIELSIHPVVSTYFLICLPLDDPPRVLLPPWAIIAIAVGGSVVLTVLCITTILCIVCCCCCKNCCNRDYTEKYCPTGMERKREG